MINAKIGCSRPPEPHVENYKLLVPTPYEKYAALFARNVFPFLAFKDLFQTMRGKLLEIRQIRWLGALPPELRKQSAKAELKIAMIKNYSIKMMVGKFITDLVGLFSGTVTISALTLMALHGFSFMHALAAIFTFVGLSNPVGLGIVVGVLVLGIMTSYIIHELVRCTERKQQQLEDGTNMPNRLLAHNVETIDEGSSQTTSVQSHIVSSKGAFGDIEPLPN